ncbi:MAG: YdiU family protein [Pseudomonadales bacterium]|nr:YdiU family protein [Pseudomonadales bacterium]
MTDGLDRLAFDNRFTRSLPADPDTRNVRRQVSGAIYSRVTPATVVRPELVAVAREVLELLGLDPEAADQPAFVETFAGNRLLPGMDAHATCYGGHQFGNWAGQLGDGRAINLGEVRCPDGELRMLQLKGAGPTPYSRTADGLAVLRSSVREFLCSEAMHHLGVPTTRALSLTLTGEQVLRDMLYDGNAALEPGAVVCRVAPSFLRFGHFEILAARGEKALLRRLLDFAIDAHFPDIAAAHPAGGPAAYASLFETVAERTASLVAEWMRVGFVHGVMNTDNMSLLGLTIDYGPYGWLEDYDPDWTPNTTDAEGRRYRFGNQPAVAHWNLLQLANAIYPAVGDAAPLEAALRAFPDRYRAHWETRMAAKLGLERFEPATDVALTDGLHTMLRSTETDVTIFFRALAGIDAATQPEVALAALQDAWYRPKELVGSVLDGVRGWLAEYQRRLAADGLPDAERRARMNAANPKYVLRNYLAQLAIDAAGQGDYGMIHELLETLRSPYDEQPARAAWAARRPDWARSRVGCSMLSCSS